MLYLKQSLHHGLTLVESRNDDITDMISGKKKQNKKVNSEET